MKFSKVFLKRQYTFLSIVLVVLFQSCISDIDLTNNFEGSYVVVDAVLKQSNTTELDSTDFKVKLSTTFVSGNGANSYQSPIKNEKVELIVNQTQVVTLDPISPAGTYYLKDKSLLKIGNSYQLKFTVGSKKYESTLEIMPDSVPITHVFTEFNAALPETAHQVFVDVNDIANTKNYYSWTYRLFEKQEYCFQCYTQQRAPSICRPDIYPTIDTRVSISLNCSSDCWDIVPYKKVNIISDQFFDGKPLLKKAVGYVPYNFGTGCLVEVLQLSTTPQYFKYLELLKNIASGSGGLVDTPPAILVGNVKNINDINEKVIGYFTVASTSKRRIWIDRKDAKAAGLSPISFRNPSVPPPAGSTISPVPCTPSETRTNVKPTGWQN